MFFINVSDFSSTNQWQQSAHSTTNATARSPRWWWTDGKQPIQLPAPHHLEPMIIRCPYCAATYFREEVNEDGIFTKCCHDGAVSLPPVQPPSQHVVTRVLTIHGQTYHLTAQEEAPQGRQPQYEQLYILDTNQAMQQRINDPCNVNLQPMITQILQDDLLAINQYARQYHNICEILRRERETNVANNQPVRPVRMVITTHPTRYRWYDNPTASEIAAVYIGEDCLPPDPQTRETEIYPANEAPNNTTKIKIISHNADPLTYPLIFFRGDYDWNINIPWLRLPHHQRQGDSNHRTRVHSSNHHNSMFPSSERWMYQNYQDAMTIVTK